MQVGVNRKGPEMRYELRTRFTLPSGSPLNPGEIGRADRLLRWLYETLPTKATVGGDVALPRWLGNRYTETDIVFELVTQYRDVFALTADRLRIVEAMIERPPALQEPGVSFEVMRQYGDPELVDLADPSKKLSHPC